jgi:hypothetical protein
MIAGWINRHQQQVIDYLLEENRPFTLLGATYRCSFQAGQLVESRIIIAETPSDIERCRERRCSDRGVCRIRIA